MPGALRKTMLFLGLSEEDPREEYPTDVAMEPYEDDYANDYEVPAPAEVTTAAVTPLPSASLRRITTVHPRSYNDAKVIGESFRAGTPVILNLTDMSDSDAKRLVDFSAGLVFGLRGAIERVTTKVFLLSPASVEVSSETAEPEATGARFFNQS